ncbi:DMT family transporter [Kistimonas asteriae]|uniref:DMT family transporter n=1 Tax=Kistimonas asteriae TaxID=517724 RepID=UPI001BAC16C5|nr:DMT family transporter [Kistimonas asteriae]
MNSTHSRQGHLLAFAGALCLTPDGVLVRLAGVDDWSLVFWRGAMIGVALFLIMALRYRANVIQQWVPRGSRAWLGSALFAVSSMTFVMGITHTSIANALVILSTTPLFAAVYGRLFLGETTARRTWVAMGLAVVGIAVVFAGDLQGGGWLGNLFALACACLTAAHITVIRSASGKINVMSVYGWGGLLVAVACLLIVPSLALSLKSFLVLAVMGLLSGLAFFMLGEGARRVPAPEVTLMMLLEPTIGPIWAFWVLGEIPSGSTVIGGVIVVATLVTHSLYSLYRQKAQ